MIVILQPHVVRETEAFRHIMSFLSNLQRINVRIHEELGAHQTLTELYLIGDTCAYGTHGLTVQMVGGQKALTLYNAPYSKFVCDVVYTNKPTPGAFRGYGAMQCYFGLETLMSEIAARCAVERDDGSESGGKPRAVQRTAALVHAPPQKNLQRAVVLGDSQPQISNEPPGYGMRLLGARIACSRFGFPSPKRPSRPCPR